MILRVT